MKLMILHSWTKNSDKLLIMQSQLGISSFIALSCLLDKDMSFMSLSMCLVNWFEPPSPLSSRAWMKVCEKCPCVRLGLKGPIGKNLRFLLSIYLEMWRKYKDIWLVFSEYSIVFCHSVMCLRSTCSLLEICPVQ